MFDWNDLRYFIAVARVGSTLAAGRSMRVSQTTVSRRIAALEQSLGLLLFDRRQAGYALTPAGKQLLDRAIVVEQAALSFAEAAGFQSRDNSGTVRVTTSDIFSNTFLPPWLAELHEAHPDIRIELDECGTVRDLGAGEADVAIRSTAAAAPPESSAGGFARTNGPFTAAATTPPGTASRAPAPRSTGMRWSAVAG
ncbi:LysR family transcriptional regulator [Sphingomonas rhizophila]|uniref:LysR family transcriptional regulator n=1 Tax=Sphingomonas rhizophila TaxID=2071607 RepID=UPI00248406E7|nr:LysR family transcriptional regulator [Sphingomonas rhizophila]